MSRRIAVHTIALQRIYMSCNLRAVTLLLLCGSPHQADSIRLQNFRAEVERATHKTVVIEELESDPHFAGITECDDAKTIRIKIGRSLTGDVRTGVIAHELGHALNCGKIAVTRWQRPFIAPPPINSELLREARAAVGGCALEKAADGEALRRGFNLEPRDAATKANFARWTAADLQKVYLLNGPIYANVIALQQFCFEYRDADYKDSTIENQIIGSVSGSQPVLIALRREVTIHSCKTAKECFEATKQVRHAAGFDHYFLLIDPVTGKAG
jgi:hypothetical protein